MARSVEELLPYILTVCDEVGECLVWSRSYNPQGYPQMGAAAVGLGRVTPVHRAVFFLTNGRNPEKGSLVHHSCFNKGCCNPAHLVEMTVAEHNLLHAIERHKDKGHEYRPKRRGKGCAECNRLAAKKYRATRW